MGSQCVTIFEPKIFRWVLYIGEIHTSSKTGYGLDGPGIESRWGRYFPLLSTPALGPHQPPVQWVPGLSPGVKSDRGVTLTAYPLIVP